MKLSITAAEPMEKVTAEDLFANFVGDEAVVKNSILATNSINEKCNLKQLPTMEAQFRCIVKYGKSIETQAKYNIMKQSKDVEKDIEKDSNLLTTYLIYEACKHYNSSVDDAINKPF